MPVRETQVHSLKPLPELLAPAGSPEALEAALAAGADAVYLGGTAFNARMNAHNFDRAALEAAVAKAHGVGSRVYLTLNTLIYDRELADALEAAYEAAVCGVDGLIIADVGAAALIRRALPDLPLHASTQLSGHNRRVGEILAPWGFSRYVTARESTLEDIRTSVADSGLEVEVFVHGALCVSHSGQCLFSSVVGGRSGNRGACAQPCRLPYGPCRESKGGGGRPGKGGEGYPLSLKDLSLAQHLPALIDAGVASLKIEGRMKSPAYVGGVVSIWRRLLDERRAATPDEMRALADLFSREGFTDGYLTGKVSHAMMGVRSEADKARTDRAERSSREGGGAPLPVALQVTAREGEPVTLTASAPLFRQANTHDVTVTVTGDTPVVANNPAVALTAATLEKQLTRMGGTAYATATFDAQVEEGLLLPVSRLNALRRAAVDALDAARASAMPCSARGYDPSVKEGISRRDATTALEGEGARTARFYRPTQITPLAEESFDILYLPLDQWAPGPKRGVILPPVIFDRESDEVIRRLAKALQEGARHLLVGNLGHLPLVREAMSTAALTREAQDDVTLHGDFRLNVTNGATVERLLSLGFADLVVSPELTMPRLRDLFRRFDGRLSAITYGRLPLMLLEKCVIRELYGKPSDHASPCGRAGEACRVCGRDAAVMTDRKGMTFPILREWSHRNTVLNSLPLSMTDRADELIRAGVNGQHAIFTVETPEQVDGVIRAIREGRPVGGEVRRMLR